MDVWEVVMFASRSKAESGEPKAEVGARRELDAKDEGRTDAIRRPPYMSIAKRGEKRARNPGDFEKILEKSRGWGLGAGGWGLGKNG